MTSASAPRPDTPHYRRPGRTTRMFNAVVAWCTRRGISIWGSRVLEVPGRRSGLPRRTPVNLLRLDGSEYLVAPRGEAEWVRNVRANGGRLTLVLGRTSEARQATEVVGDAKADVLRAYLKKWAFETGAFFNGVKADASDEVLRAEAARHPVFALQDPVV